MKIATYCELTELPIGTLAMLVLYSSVGLGQQLPDEQGGPEVPETLDEITVYGEKNLVRLRVEFEQAKESFWDVFNELNIDDQFDVECEYVTQLGSYRKFHDCKPWFQEKLERQATLDMISSGNFYDYRREERRLRSKKALMEKELTRLLSERQEIQESAARVLRAKDAYESEQERRSNKDDPN